jgi:hypothetical protein
MPPTVVAARGLASGRREVDAFERRAAHGKLSVMRDT